MGAITFDTLKFVERLTAAGVPEAQAKAEATALSEALQTSEVATERDMDRLSNRIDQLDAKVSGELTLVKWMLGAVLGLTMANFAKQFF